MAVEIVVPPLSQTMDSLVILEWFKKIGDPVAKGETLFTVETDKATLEVESPASGILKSILAQAGEEVKVRSIIGSIAEPGEVLDESADPEIVSSPQSSQPATRPLDVPLPQIVAAGPAGETLSPERLNRLFSSPRARQRAWLEGISLEELRGRGTGPEHSIVERDVETYLESKKSLPRATPLARRMAEANGVNLTQLIPEGAGRTIKKADVEMAISSKVDGATTSPAATTPATGTQVGDASAQPVVLTPTRKTIARRMLGSHQTTAPVTYLVEADATRLVKLRKRILKYLPEGAIRPTYTDFLIFMTCCALRRHPALNATYENDLYQLHSAIHIALAVDTERGLIVPVLRDAHSKGIEEIGRLRSDLVRRVMAERVSPQELSGGTFTISNLGQLGIDYFTPLINPPQVAVLGIGRIRKIPLVHKRKIRTRSVLGLVLTCDHRVIDGAPAARFLAEISQLVERPEMIWLES